MADIIGTIIFSIVLGALCAIYIGAMLRNYFLNIGNLMAKSRKRAGLATFGIGVQSSAALYIMSMLAEHAITRGGSYIVSDIILALLLVLSIILALAVYAKAEPRDGTATSDTDAS